MEVYRSLRYPFTGQSQCRGRSRNLAASMTGLEQGTVLIPKGLSYYHTTAPQHISYMYIKKLYIPVLIDKYFSILLTLCNSVFFEITKQSNLIPISTILVKKIKAKSNWKGH